MIIQGNCLEVLKTLHDESVDCIVTSPPYWGLRDYGVKDQLGQENDFREYINKLCDIFDEIKRVLKKEGTCLVNLGDTYAGTSPKYPTTNCAKNNRVSKIGTKTYLIKDKCLVQIPSRFSIEMCNRGWILRNKIIWHKPNAMPSSVTDRFTVDFEEILFFVKSKKYYFEQQFDPFTMNSDVEYRRALRRNKDYSVKYPYKNNSPKSFNPKGKNKRSVWSIATRPFKDAHFATYPEALIEPMIRAGCPTGGIVLDPFFGAGTTGIVALKQNKKYIGIEINSEYIKIAKNRLRNLILPML